MNTESRPALPKRFSAQTEAKSKGITYTPALLADFVADQMIEAATIDQATPITILDPAIGDGALAVSLLKSLRRITVARISVFAFDTSFLALQQAQQRISTKFPEVDLFLRNESFLSSAIGIPKKNPDGTLFSELEQPQIKFDLIVANPPYVRTQILGAGSAQDLTKDFGLSGRVDLYHAFLISICQALKPSGTAGIIVSNRFMTTRGGASVRAALRDRVNITHIWDLGDTKLFDAAVLPAVIVANGTSSKSSTPSFTSIYETSEQPTLVARNPVHALASSGIVEVDDSRKFSVRHGKLDRSGPSNDVWRIATADVDAWMSTVSDNQFAKFSDIGKIRVGVKTCADKIFIREDWTTIRPSPELLRTLTTHHVAGRYRPSATNRQLQILYPHESVQGQRRVVDLNDYPSDREYLEQHRVALEQRTYVIEAGRKWYELWVPQDPASWSQPKLVFRDISERPNFWVDLDGTVVNGDCYWMTPRRPQDEPLLWLAAAVANSTLAEAFYDHKFNNKLYSGRRRFITQYVQDFPLPDPKRAVSKEIISKARKISGIVNATEFEALESELDGLVWGAFNLIKKTDG